MSDPIHNFEFLLNKQGEKRLKSLYSDVKQQKKPELKPQDVISSVALQIRAIQVADSITSEKCVRKDIEKYKKSTFLSVNNLPVYEEVPKHSTKFDTQCVSDTQLINIMEDAVITDVHRGMTQEFETTFCYHTEKQDLKEDKRTDIGLNENVSLNNKKADFDTEIVPLDTQEVLVGTEKMNPEEQIVSVKECMDEDPKTVAEVINDGTIVNSIDKDMDINNSISIISPIMCDNNIREKAICDDFQGSNEDKTPQLEVYSQILTDCIEIQDDSDMVIERPLSPIFLYKHVKTKSKTPSPLIFNLDRFEQFEKIAIPILVEADNLKTAKQVINSQILDKELNIKTDDEIQLNQREILSPVLQSKSVNILHSPPITESTEFKSHIVKNPDSDTELEFIELDKVTSEDLINKIMHDNIEDNAKARADSVILKDEILFSSDEEESYVHKSYQDLPFTCALETSFYNQSDILDKTMYVGFQTASNKSIQVFTDSFAQAKSLLSNDTFDEVTVTDLVENCNSIANKTKGVNDDLVHNNGVESEFNCEEGIGVEHKKIQDNEIQAETNSFEGFKTASKKEINLTEKALARCRKVFQDIDISKDFGSTIDVDLVSNLEKREEKTNLAINYDDLQNFDDVIIQEFENIEMSLEENKGIDKNTSIEFKTASNKDIEISETALSKIKDVFKDINFDEELNEVDMRETNVEKKTLSKEDTKTIEILSETNLGGFKTASNKNITISKEALAKTKNIFQDLDSTKLPDKSSKLIEKTNKNWNAIKQSCTETFVGFKTANNKDIKITKLALAKTNNIFKDIDSMEFKLPKKSNNISEHNIDSDSSTSKDSFVGFQTANNRDNNIARKALANPKKIYDCFDSADLTLVKDVPNAIAPDISARFAEPNLPSTGKDSFLGFKTANDKIIKISAAATAKTKNVFKDIDSAELKFPEKGMKENIKQSNRLENNSFVAAEAKELPTIAAMDKSSYTGFRTANNREIKEPDTALARTKSIFKDIDSDDFTFPSKPNKEINIKDGVEEADNNVDYEMTDMNKPSTSKDVFIGFKTANNKQISISKEAIEKSKSIFKDIDSTDLKLPDKDKKGLNTFELTKQTSCNAHEHFNLPATSKAPTASIKTANNKQTCKESTAKTMNIFKDVDTTDFKFPNETSIDFKTVDQINEYSKDIKKKVTHEYEFKDINQPSTSKECFIGFKTASNRKVNISKESLAKTKNIFKDIDSNDFVYPKIPSRELENTIKERKSAYPDLKGEQPQMPCSVGFKTANDKIIKVSEAALAKTKNIFKNVDSTEFQLQEKNEEDYLNIEFDTHTESGFFNEAANNVNAPETAVPKFQGFQTASNKQVKISADALIKSRQIFQAIDVNDDLNIESEGTEDKQHNIFDNDKELLHIDKEMDDVYKDLITDNSRLSGQQSPVFKGFQTANKKPVRVSKEALAKSRKLFQDIDVAVEDDPEPEFHGFKIANAKDVEISEKALTESKKIFENVVKNTSFKGFQTASDKKVVVSEDSLAKSRKMFQDIESHGKIENILRNAEKRTSNIKFGLKTSTNRDIVVTDEAVPRSKRFFSEVDDSKDEFKNNRNDTLNQENISIIIDTQVINNFEESLHTEDFRETPAKSKRSGSPILSCPRAKRRRKFETPYSQKLPKPEIIKEIVTNNVNKVSFSDNYKKIKKYTLKELAELTQNSNATIDPYLINFNFDNLLQFEFSDGRNGFSHSKMTMDSLKELFLNSINSKLIPNGWIDNHLKQIIWKLISYEIRFKSAIMCNAKNVIDQLKYRYDKELYNAQRPALRRILEKDDVASKTIVLCVAGVYVDGVTVTSASTTNNVELLLTDGWYCIRATIDKMLAQLVCQGKIGVGSKIVTNGAELVGCEQGISPWEDTSAVRLKIFGNSTRRAKWDARLGYQGNGAILSQLTSVKVDGGKVSKLRVFVTRVYPALYVEKFEDGSTVTRSERLEHLHQMKSEAERQAVMEKIYEEVEREFSDQESQDSDGLSDLSNKRKCLDSGSQIAKVMKRSKDPAEFRAGLTSSQSRLLEAHTCKHRERLLQNIQQKIQDKIEKAGVCVNRNVVTLLKIRVAGVRERNGVEVSKGMMSIWKPTDAVLEIIKEGAWIDVMNVVPTAVRYSELQISAGRQSVFSISKYKEPEKCKPFTKLLKRNCFTVKDLAQNPSMSTDYNEIDTVGFIFLIDPSVQEFDSNKQPFQNVFVADVDKNMICINFWGGLKKFGFQNVLDTGQIVACANLQKRAGNTRKSIPQYRVTEYSFFTKTPKNENARILVDELSKNFLSLDRRKFCDDCVVLKNNYSIFKINSENISPYRFNNSDYNMSRNKLFIDSPLARSNKIDDIFNLTGLDFESTFKQTDTQNLSEKVLLRKKKVNEKIARLKMYGEPPPLSTIHIINRSKNATSSYKSPLNTKNDNSKNIAQKSRIENSDSSVNVANDVETPEKYANFNETDAGSSPVLLNRTYLKSVNPVKLNFDVKDKNDSNVDHFAEDFDGSPPLSLD